MRGVCTNSYAGIEPNCGGRIDQPQPTTLREVRLTSLNMAIIWTAREKAQLLLFDNGYFLSHFAVTPVAAFFLCFTIFIVKSFPKSAEFRPCHLVASANTTKHFSKNIHHSKSFCFSERQLTKTPAMPLQRSGINKNLKRKAKDANLKDHRGQSKLSVAGASTSDSIRVAALAAFQPRPTSQGAIGNDDRPGDHEAHGVDTMTTEVRVKGDESLLACPFFKHDRNAHMSCLGLTLRRIKDVKEHLWRRHFVPYCPKCWTEFRIAKSPAKARDDHIKTCSHKSPPPGTKRPEAADEQRTDWGRAERLAGQKAQWNHIYKVIFPNASLPSSPFVTSILEEAIDELRPFWDKNVSKIVPRALAAAEGKLHPDWTTTFATAVVGELVSCAIAASADNVEIPTATEEHRVEPGDPYHGLKVVAADIYGPDASTPVVNNAPVPTAALTIMDQAPPSGNAVPPDNPAMPPDKEMMTWHGDSTAHQSNTQAFYPNQEGQANIEDDHANINQTPHRQHGLNLTGGQANSSTAAPAGFWSPLASPSLTFVDNSDSSQRPPTSTDAFDNFFISFQEQLERQSPQ